MICKLEIHCFEMRALEGMVIWKGEQVTNEKVEHGLAIAHFVVY